MLISPAMLTLGHVGGSKADEPARPLPQDAPGADELRARVLGILRTTVAPGLREPQLQEFIEYLEREHPAALQPAFPADELERLVCTQFIVNSNLMLADISRYAFVLNSGICNPFYPG